MIYLLTAIGLTPGGSSTVHIYTHIHKQYKNTEQTMQNTVNTSIRITKTPIHYKTHKYTHPCITKPTHTHTHTLQNKLKQPQYKLKQIQYKTYPN